MTNITMCEYPKKSEMYFLLRIFRGWDSQILGNYGVVGGSGNSQKIEISGGGKINFN